MKYDRDIRRTRIALWAIVAVDLIWAGVCLYLHQWAYAIACGIWTLNAWAQLGTLARQQVTRDASRVIEAAVQGVLDV